MLKHSNKFISTIIFSVLLLATILSTVAFVNQSIEYHTNQSHAGATIKNLNVLTIGYYPPDASNPNILDAHITGKTQSSYPYTIQQWEQITQQQAASIANYAGQGSKYHGYSNSSAIQYLNYNILTFRPYTYAEPLSTVKAWDPGALFPNYNKILTDNNICNYVNTLGVKQVWVFAYQPSPSFSGSTQPQESMLSANTAGNIANSVSEGSQFNPPRCNSSYTMFNFDYGMEYVANSLHDMIHQVENTVSYMDYDNGINHWPACYNPKNLSNSCGADNVHNSMFWGNFSQYIQTGSVNNSSCGNAHYTPNWASVSSDQYNYTNTAYHLTNCTTWNPDKTKTNYSNVNCQAWGCTDIGFYVWYMQSMPGYANGIVYQGKYMRNWWDVINDFDGFIYSGGRKLFSTTPQNAQVYPQSAYQPNYVNANGDGRLETFYRGTDGNIWDNQQTSANHAWNGWASLLAPSVGQTNLYTTGSNQDGRLEIVMNAKNGTTWHDSQSSANSSVTSWTGWNLLGNTGNPTGVKFLRQPIMAKNQNGQQAIFNIGSDNNVWVSTQVQPNSTWGNWTTLGTPTGISIVSLTANHNQDGRVEIVASGSDGNVWHNYEQAVNGTSSWSGWQSLGRPTTASAGSVIVGSNQDGRMEIFMTGSDKNMYHIYQVKPNSGWSGWSILTTATNGLQVPQTNPINQTPVVVNNADGHLEIFAFGIDGILWHVFQLAPNSGWSGWGKFGSPTGVNINSFTINNNLDGRLELMMTGSDGNAWHNYQSAPNKSWVGWQSLSHPSQASFN